MEDTQRTTRVAAENVVDQVGDETRDEQSTAGPVFRTLANPRRVRRT